MKQRISSLQPMAVITRSVFASGHLAKAVMVFGAFAYLIAQRPALSQTPLKLAVFASPSTIVFTDQTHITVQVQDASGRPVCVSQPVTINLTSMNLSVIKPYYSAGDERGVITLGPRPITANAGQNPNVDGVFFNSAGAGTTTITASAPGFASGSTTITVLPRPARPMPPVALKLYVQPSAAPACRSDQEKVGSGSSLGNYMAIQTIDANGNPTSDGKRFDVTMTSTDPAVANVASFLFYGDAGYSHWTNMTVGQKAGATTLSIAARGLRGDSVRVTTFSCSAAVPTATISEPKQASQTSLKLAVFASPSKIVAGDQTHVTVQVQDAAGRPVCVSQPVAIHLTSMNLAIVKPYYSAGDERGAITLGPRPISANAGQNPNVEGTYLNSVGAGTTTITASAPGYTSGSTAITVLLPPARPMPPVALKLYVQPPVVPACRTDQDKVGSGSSLGNYVVIQTVDANGNPTSNGKRFDVKVTSTDAAVANFSSFLFYGDAGYSNSASLTVGQKAGATTLSVSAQGLRGDSASVSTFHCSAGAGQ